MADGSNKGKITASLNTTTNSSVTIKHGNIPWPEKHTIQNDLKWDSGIGNGALMVLTKCLGDHNLQKQNNNLQCGSLEISLMRKARDVNC